MKATLKASRAGEPERRFQIVERAIIGSGSDSAIRFEDAQMLGQHFSVKPMDDGVKLRLAHGAPPMMHEGKDFVGGLIPYDADFFVGAYRFTVARTESVVGKGGPSPVILVAAAAAVAIMVLSFFAPEKVDGSAANEIKIPELFGPVPCGAAEGQPLHRAHEAERGAAAKQERYVFDPHDGVLAGRLLAEASSCYGKAGDADGAKRTAEAGIRWQERVRTDITAARLRLELALENKDLPRALDNVRELLKLLHGEALPEVDQLVRLGSRIEHQLKGR